MTWFLTGFLVFVFLMVGWDSVQSLMQAALLRRCRRASLAGLVGRAAALRGAIKVHQVLRIAHIGDVLWHRETVKSIGRRHESTQSRLDDKAEFSIVVGGEEVRVADCPTEVQGAARKSTTERSDFVDSMLGGSDEKVIDEWLPILDEMTVVGRVRRNETRWVLDRHPRVGLLFSRHDPARAALHETLSGVFGLVIAIAGLAGSAWFLLARSRMLQ